MSRRTLLTAAATLALPAAATDRPPAPAAAAPHRPRLKIVVAGGHPGDPECGCGGAIARCADAGHDVVLMYLNRGEGGDPEVRDLGTVRTREAVEACGLLKARPVFAGQIDGQAVVDRAHYGAFRELLALERPDVVFTHWPIDNHADHRAMTNLVFDAWVKEKRRFALLYYEVSNGEDTLQFAPTFYIDISEVEPRKRNACRAHASQRPERFYALQETITRMRGVEIGCRHAEGFVLQVPSLQPILF